MLYTYLKEIGDLTERKRTINHLIKLREQLDEEIPEKTANNTLSWPLGTSVNSLTTARRKAISTSPRFSAAST